MSEYLPVEIVERILKMMPVKSLIIGKAVCRRWRDIISDPEFAKSQFQFAIANQTLSRSLLFSITPQIPQLESLELDCIPFGDRASANSLRSPVTRLGHDVLLLGSCNGFICACLGFGDFFIWNPSTGRYRPVPPPPHPASEFGYVSDTPFQHFGGFGYVSTSQDYKIVLSAQIEYVPAAEIFQSVGVQVFSVKNEMWGEVIVSPCAGAVEGQGVTVQGKLHWVIRYYAEDEDDEEHLVAFDLESEQFRAMRLPPIHNVEPDDIQNFSVALFCSNEHLCLWDYDKRDASIHYWVMEIYGDSGSWSRPYTFSIYNESPVRFLKPLVVTESTIVLIKCSTAGDLELLRIGHQGETERVIYMHGWESRDYQHESLTILYEHSLLSLPRRPEIQ